MNYKFLLTLLFSVLLLTVVGARVAIDTTDGGGGSVNIITITGNLTNLSEMLDVNTPAPSDWDVLTWDDTAGTWVASTDNNDSILNYILEVNNSINNYIAENNGSIENYILYVNSTNFQVEVDPYWKANWTAYNDTWTNSFDQDLNTDDNVNFNDLNATGTTLFGNSTHNFIFSLVPDYGQDIIWNTQGDLGEAQIYRSINSDYYGYGEKAGDFVFINEDVRGSIIFKQYDGSGDGYINDDPHISITNTSIEIMPKVGSNIELNGTTNVTGNFTIGGGTIWYNGSHMIFT